MSKEEEMEFLTHDTNSSDLNCPLRLPETIHFAKEEEKTLEKWKTRETFEKSMQLSRDRPRYSFYDGPPFATGLPHYGHILAGTIKDIVTRYAYQCGYHVERRFGWDCHGLPVENEIDKEYNIKGPDDVAKMGIKEYNLKCRKIVMRYADEWEKIITRVGRWIDFSNDYKTMYSWYMESIWYIFKQLYNKGLVYKSSKVMPYSTACNTVLSNFEAGQNYKDVVDPSVVVAFPLLAEPGVSLLAWTTTPWTLPSNLTLCVNPTFEYVEVKDNASGNIYIILEAQLKLVFKSPDLYTILGKRKGVDLKGKEYEPPFPYFKHHREKGAFKVLNDTYVTAETGTGVVHQAPYFGEDDYRCCLEAGVITKEQKIVCPVDSCGRFVEPVRDFLGMYVKDADKEIIKYLKANKKLIVNSTVKHSYPFCWRTDTPLIYKAVPSWFLRVELIKEQLLTANNATYWVPNYVKEKRFGNWLRDARDWAISRNRYWGNPIPLWISDDQEEIVCIGSIEELEQLTGTKITDIHRESIDHLEIPSRRSGHPPLRRIPEVFDCWFESGSMPYAQVHYPFKQQEDFDKCFPADFIAEGIDQTRGWFYTLLVISTALFGKAPYKNLVVNGLILASDGQKMSKRKKNYPDPLDIISKYGADALRLYLINSPVVRADNLRFKEEGVRDIIKDVLLPWYNAFRFLVQNIDQFEREMKERFVFDETNLTYSDNIMDKWIISFTQTLLVFVGKEMTEYRLYTVVPYLIKYIDNLTNWYVRMNRKRIKNEDGYDDCKNALKTLFLVIYTMVRVYAPFTPFITEYMFNWLSRWLHMEANTSVHFQMLPQPCDHLINNSIERAVSHMQTVIELARIVRDRKTIPTKYPLREIVVIHQDEEVLKDILLLKAYVLEELNVRKLTVTSDKEKYGVTLRAEPDHKTLGARLKGEFKQIMQAIKELSDEQLQKFVATKEIIVEGHKLEEQDLRLMFNFTGPTAKELSKQYEAHNEGSMLILLDITRDEELYNEGIAREVINRVQKMRKKTNLIPSDEAIVFYDFKDMNSTLAKVIISHRKFIENTTKTPLKDIADFSQNTNYVTLSSEMQTIKEEKVMFSLARKQAEMPKQNVENRKQKESQRAHVFMTLIGLQPRFDAARVNGHKNIVKIWLCAEQLGIITHERLKQEIELVFGIYGCSYDLYLNNEKFTVTIDNTPVNINLLNGQTIKVVKPGMPLSSD
ncbi:Isoleucyl-tRNA synthetase, cytoplasmic [Camponotus floridanus]|uniref:Isoleucine--tRNA ligase, cytoplasmic n=1 Tax=Camponotus floridanus TaxID=104421 RepID=E2A0G1_CAMFO|nr:Isoleucyl-tRNA synthetase, cytoplasmic [Camponotus floridanus]